MGSKLIKPLETYDTYLNISVSIILPLSIVVKAHLITVSDLVNRGTSTAEGCRQACMIGLSINEDTKLEKGKKGGAVGLYKYLARAAKALVVSELMAIFYTGHGKS